VTQPYEESSSSVATDACTRRRTTEAPPRSRGLDGGIPGEFDLAPTNPFIVRRCRMHRCRIPQRSASSPRWPIDRRVAARMMPTTPSRPRCRSAVLRRSTEPSLSRQYRPPVERDRKTKRFHLGCSGCRVGRAVATSPLFSHISYSHVLLCAWHARVAYLILTGVPSPFSYNRPTCRFYTPSI